MHINVSVKTMRKLLFSVVTIICSLTGYSQSYDERIANAMNSGDWFALDSIYNAAPKDSIMPFLEVYSRGLIGNRLNRPDISIPAFEELLQSHTANLDLSNLLNSAVMLSMDLSKTGDNAKAASVLSSVFDATKQYLDSAAVEGMQRYIDQYMALSVYKPYSISFSGEEVTVPFRIKQVGKYEREALLMYLDDCGINGTEADIVFDTGAGVNIISDSLARAYNLIPLDAYNNVMGIGRQKGHYAIAKELKLGNVVIRDVPFLVVNMTLDNEEANMYIDCYSIVVGSELMLQLKDMTVDFTRRKITVPSTAPERSGTPANMFFSPQMNLLTQGIIHNDAMLVCIDTGDASYGSLNGDFFNRNKGLSTYAQPDTIRTAGIGGVKITEGYRLPDVSATIGGRTVSLPQIFVSSGLNAIATEYECNLGLKSLMQFGKIRFNLVDFTIETLPSEILFDVENKYKPPVFRFMPDKKPTLWQSIGLVALSVANGLCNVNAPSAPDL